MTDATAAALPAGPPVRSGASVYLRALEVSAGGREVEALQCGRDALPVYAAIYASHPYALSVPALSVPRLAINLTGARVSGGVEGDRSRSFEARRHSVFLTPAGAPVTWRKESPSRHLGIYFDPHLLDGANDAAPRPDAAHCLQNAIVPGVGSLADQIVHELQNTGMLKAEAVDSLARLLLVRLIRRTRPGASASASASAVLTPKIMEHLREYIVAHLPQRILVADLAAQVGLSPNHFAVSFTERTGLPPHRFVLSVRVERAAALLARPGMTLAQVAHHCGFSSQQHFSNVFRKALGMTPSRYRSGERPSALR